MPACEHHQWPILGQVALATPNGFFIQRRDSQIPVDRFQVAEPVPFKTERIFAVGLRHYSPHFRCGLAGRSAVASLAS